MDRLKKSLIMSLTLCALFAGSIKAEDANDLDGQQEPAVTIALTRLDVNDTNLELRYKIKNNTDHDVWVCDSIDTRRTFNFEVFLAEDAETLVIRRRLDVPTSAIWRVRPVGEYILLRQGESRPESLALSLPIQPTFAYASKGPTEVTEFIKCIVLEIGFYDEDLPAMIRSILQAAENFIGTTSGVDSAIIKDYFRGLLVKSSLGTLESFNTVNKDPYGEGNILITYSYQALTGEKVLSIKLDGVSIPYQGRVQSISHSGNKEKHVQNQKKISRKEKPDLEEG